jgi:osmoprotectant transport system permease protein
MARDRALELGIEAIGDLVRHPYLSFGFSSEFMERGDGWPGLRDRYGLPQSDVRGMEHDLAYRGVAQGDLDVTDLYATDSKIEQFDLAPLEDDLGFFPDYQAVILYRSELNDSHPTVVASWKSITGKIDDGLMTTLNARADLDRLPDTRVAAEFLRNTMQIVVDDDVESVATSIWNRTVEHLRLVGWSMLAAILIGVPLGIIAAKSNPVGAQSILGSVGVVQTIPALALLVFMLPLFGVGDIPAIGALFLYSLLPIVRNTFAGLVGIRTELREAAEALGLPAFTRMVRIEFPLASRSILAGIKTSVVINIGTATLGALIGSGGYGQPIFTGVQLNNVPMILQGAIPAAVLALVAQGIFEIVERLFVPRGLRLSRHK